jgi:catechol 2,3-dioxygenase-like lactoylglutathione lyase family enzyme
MAFFATFDQPARAIACARALTEAFDRHGLQIRVVPDIHAARAELLERGVEVGEIQHFESGGMVSGAVDEPYGSFIFFNDPDGNAWAVQEGPKS